MIHLITPTNRHLYRDVLEEMFRARTRHFVFERGWSNLSVEAGCEQDAYDTDQTLYLAGFDADGAITISARLIPADAGCVLADHFAHLVSDGPPRGPGVYELSRYFTPPSVRGRASFPIKAAMNVAIVEAMVEFGARRLVGLTDLHILGGMRYSGWRVRPIGIPAEYEEGTAAAFEIACQAGDLAEMREALGMPGRQLYQAPAWAPGNIDLRRLADATEVVVRPARPVREAVAPGVSRWRPQGDLGDLFARLGERQAA
jgi:acyl-homoserine lactone synthase